MKYEVGTKLEYIGNKNYIIEIICYDDDAWDEYTCKVCKGSQDRVGKLWQKSERYLDENYKVIKEEPYTEQKSKLVL